VAVKVPYHVHRGGWESVDADGARGFLGSATEVKNSHFYRN